MTYLGKKTKLTLGIAAMLVLSGCGYKEKKAEREAAAERERIAAIEKAERENKEREKDMKIAIFDSLMNVPNTVGGMSANQAYKVFWSAKLHDRQELDSLKSVRMADVLHERVIESGKKIAEKHLKALSVSLATYGLIKDTGAKIQKILDCYYREDIYFGANKNKDEQDYIDDEEVFYRDYESLIVDRLLEETDIGQYGASRQSEIIDIVKKRYAQMMSELKSNRIAIAKEFADYYPILDINRIPKQYRKYFDKYDVAMKEWEGPVEYSYKDAYFGTGISVEKSVKVYDSKLKPEFFNVPGATYKLVQVAKGKWKVVRTLKSGKKDETHVFTDNVDYCTVGNVFVGEDVKSGDSSFRASAGINLGVHIDVREYEYVAHPTKSDELPDPNGKRAARIAKLEQKLDEMYKLSDAYDDYQRRAGELAKKMATERLGHNR